MSCGRGLQLQVPEPVDEHAPRARRIRPSTSGAGSSSAQASRDRAACPASSSAAPSARWAATGANRSRPWKVAETGSRRNGLARMSTASVDSAAACARATAGRCRGRPARSRSRTAARPAARWLPTPGSTTARHDPVRQERQRVLQRERAVPDVGGRQIVRDVDHGRAGGDALDHAVADADPLVARARSRTGRRSAARSCYAAGAAAGASRSSASTRPSTSWRSRLDVHLEAELARGLRSSRARSRRRALAAGSARLRRSPRAGTAPSTSW